MNPHSLSGAPPAASPGRCTSSRPGTTRFSSTAASTRAAARTHASRNGHFPFHPTQIDAVVVSHAHIDHCGNLPTLIRQGFDGPIYCTPPTRDLLRVMLADSAKIQEEDAAHLNIARNYAEPWVQPLYTVNDVEKVFSRLVAVPYGRDADATKTVRFRFIEAGHVLGSAMVHVVVARRIATALLPSAATWAGAGCRS